jgi:hypothetical protein
MLVVDFIAFGANLEIEKRKRGEFTNFNFKEKLENIEKTCNEILGLVKSNPKTEDILQKQKDDITYLLDKISKKSLELEERLNKFGKILLNSVEKKEEQTVPISEIIYVDDSESKES